MKKLLSSLMVVFISISSYASHIMGGMVTVAQTSYDSTSVGVYLLTDPQGINSPNTINVEKWEMNSQGWYVQNGHITLDKTTTISHQGKNVVTYVSDYLDLDSNYYRFIYKSCCWGMVSNSSNSMSSDFIISADYWHIPNNSLPYGENPLIVNLQKDTLNTMKPIWGNYNCFLSQLDSDSVNVTQTDLFSGYANGIFVPQVFTQLNMSVSNDSISWTPTMLGNFATGFEITEYRNNQLIGTQRIQWTFTVLNSTLDIEEFKQSSYYYVYDIYGNLFYEGEEIPYTDMEGMYVIYNGNQTKKVYVIK